MKAALKIWMTGLLLTMLAGAVTAQDTIVVRKDSRLDILNAKQAVYNKLAAKMTSNGLFRGYRLQVINTRSREEAFQIKTALLQRFPEEKTYLLYQSPYFKVRIGNFLERSAAEEFKRMVSKQYPQGVYVIEDSIEYKPSDQDETESSND